ncbi:FadR family transcriptional regulator [Cryobacterium algoricola]|uniref:FadR family transcriptional regulator n=1 Tax=Cryobacterium algoricola TaxID=1259183 RepID=A0ABY2IGI1_9MICO|nr:FadR family transcriptional regulator [Cryobacterium algoricola]
MLESIERDLLSGRLRPGDRLAPERALAASLGVGRSSVREAIRVLEVLGLVRTATGSGPTSGAIIVALPGGGMSALMRLQVAARGFPVADVVKTRLVLEAAVVTELAEAHGSPARASTSVPVPTSVPTSVPVPMSVPVPVPASPAAAAATDAGTTVPTPAGGQTGVGTGSLARAEQLLDAMDAQGRTEAEFLALDAQFHLALAEASGNQVITATMAGLRSAIEAYARAGVARLGSWAEASARLRLEHREIVACIRAADPAAARRAVQSHIAGYYAETRLTETPGDPGSAEIPPAVPTRAEPTRTDMT